MSGQIEDWLQAHTTPPSHIRLGLSRLKKVIRRLSLRLNMPRLIVGGTNGKGSVCHLLSAILTAGGFRVGCYTSPHLLAFSERIQISDEPAPDAAVLAALERVTAAARAAAVELTYFELTTLAAATYFAEQSCDLVILEVGLGGRLDAVNSFDADVAVITTIGLDHTEYLGSTRDLIAAEKAGICRRNKPVVIGDSDPPPRLLSAIRRRGARPHLIGEAFNLVDGRYWHYHGSRHQLANLPPPALSGAHQRRNAAMALCALECLPADYWPGAGAVRRGLHSVRLPARAQVLAGKPVTVVDVAHNPAAAAALERQLFDMGYYPHTAAVLGMLARKDVGGFIAALNRRIDSWHIACPRDGDLSAAALADAVRAQAAAPVSEYDSIAAATVAAKEKSGENGRIVITGSFLTIADYFTRTY